MYLSKQFSGRKNGQWYDTAASEEIGHAQSGSGSSYIEECLHQANGKYFLHALGAHESRYAKDGHGTEDIVPLTTAEAQQWVNKNLGADAYGRIFPGNAPPPPQKDQPSLKTQDLQAALELLKAAGYTLPQ